MKKPKAEKYTSETRTKPYEEDDLPEPFCCPHVMRPPPERVSSIQLLNDQKGNVRVVFIVGEEGKAKVSTSG